MVRNGGELRKWFRYEQYENVGIFTFVNDIDGIRLDELKALLMESIERMDRVVLNFREDIKMDQRAEAMFSSAYSVSERMNKPVIFNGYRFEKHKGKNGKRVPGKIS